MFAGRSAERQLKSWMERKGNWRFKAMLAAALPDCPYTEDDIGHALISVAHQPEAKEHHLSRAPDAEFKEARKTIRPLSYDGKTHSSGPRSDIHYNEPDYARSLANDADAGFNERDLEQGVDLDEYMGRMLVNESFTEKDVLWREQLLDVIVQGAEEAKVARDLTNVVETDTRRGDHPVRSDEVFAPEIAEGAQIPFDEVDWSQQSWEADKFGLGAYVTEELIDQGLVDLIEQNVRYIGAAVENSINRRYINTVVDNADSGNDVETNAGTSAPFGTDLDNLLEAQSNVIGNNFPQPDTMVMHNQFQLGVMASAGDNNLLFSDRSGTFDVKSSGGFPAGLFGYDNVGVLPDGPYNGSNNWGYDTDGHFGAVAYPRDLVYLYIYRDLETKDFEDPISDLEGANVRAQFDCGLGQSSAVARIKN